MTSLRVTLLGGFDVRLGSTPLALPTKKAQALLAYLAVRPGQGHPRDKLAALLWGDRRDAQARHSLRQTLFTLRKLLGPSGDRDVLSERDAIALDATVVDVDVATFERLATTGTPADLEEAASLYRGEFLAGLNVSEPAFEEWLVAERERLHELQLEVLARLLAHQSQTGAVARAIQTAVALLALDPLQEAVHRKLMRLFHQHGRRGAALRQYQICVGVLQRELGSGPEEETKRLYREILRRTHERGTEHHVTRRRPVSHRRSLSPRAIGTASGVPLVGRGEELAWLRQALARACDGRAQLVTVIGEAGLGKTRMVEELAADARERGAVMVIGRCYEAARLLAFGPWVDALQPLVSGVGADHIAIADLAPLWRAALARLFPELGEPDAPPPPDPQDSLRLFEAVEQLLVSLASSRPLVVVLEDMHWADDTSLRLLSFLSRRIDTRPLLLVATVREEELVDAPFAKRVLEGVADEQRLLLPPLSRAETTELVRLLVGGKGEASAVEIPEERVWTLSGGNPFVVVEAARDFREGRSAEGSEPWSLPRHVQDVIAARLDRLGERARHFVAVAAVIGREFDFTLLERAAGLGEAEAADVVEELVRRRIFQTVGSRLYFSHERLREVAYGRLLEPRRRVLHRLVGSALEDLGRAAGDEAIPAALAIHFAEAEEWDKALVYFREAGSRALTRAAHREAAELYQRGLRAARSLPDTVDTMKRRLELLFEYRNALLPLGDLTATAECLGEATEIAARLDDRRALGRVSSYLARYALQVRDHSGAIEHGRRALDYAASVEDHGLELPASLYVGIAYHIRGEYAKAIEFQARVISATPEGAGQNCFGLPYCPSVFSRAFLAWSLAELGRFPEAASHAHDALALAEAIDRPWDLLVGYWACGLVELIRGDVRAAVGRLERSRELCAAREFPTWRVTIDSCLGHAYALAGRLTEALPLLEHTLEPARATTIHHTRALGHLADGYLKAGRHDDALRTAQLAARLAGENAERGYEGYALHVLGETALAMEELESAEQHTRESLALAERLGMRPLAWRCHLTLGRLCHCRNRAEAMDHLERAATISREIRIVDGGEARRRN